MSDSRDTLDRPLQLATRSTKLLGAVSAGYGVFFVFAYGHLNRYQTYAIYFIAMGMIVWVLPGVVFLVQASRLQERRRSAAVTAMVAAIFQGICAASLFVANFFFTPISVIPVVLSLLWVIAIVQLIGHLYRSLPLLEIDAERRHGFDVAPAQPALPVEADGDQHERRQA